MKVVQGAALRNQYNLVKDSFDGQGGYANGSYLTKYEKEQDYGKRKEESSYFNLLGPIVEARVDPCFTTTPTRVYKPDLVLEAFLKNADNNGTPLEQIIHSVTTDTVLLGNGFIVVDNFPTPTEMSLAETVESRRFPYVYTKTVQDVYSYEVDDFGKILEITFYWGPEAPSEKRDDGYLFKKLTATEITFINMKRKPGKKLEYDESTATVVGAPVCHGLGVCPVVYYNQKVLPFSKYFSMAKQSKQLFNASSRLGELNRDQTLSILVIPGRMPDEGIQIGTANALFVDEQASNIPTYISPDSSQMTVSTEYDKHLVEQIIQSADVLGTTAIGSSNSATSGVAESYKFFGKQQALMQTSVIASYLDKGVVGLVAKFMRAEYQYSATYQDKFEPSFHDTKAKYDVYKDALALHLTPTVDAQISKDIVTIIASFGDWDDSVLNTCLESIVVKDPVPVPVVNEIKVDSES